MHNLPRIAARALLMVCAAMLPLTGCYRRADIYPASATDHTADSQTTASRDADVARAADVANDARAARDGVSDVRDTRATGEETAGSGSVGSPLGAPVGPFYRKTGDVMALPVVEREFRGVWLATVGNMDWPSRRNLTSKQAQDELLRLLDTARDLGLNAVIFQIRPMADAFYESSLEPWSDYLTGVSGRAPQPYWDPLAFAVEQAHARGLELHAWFNPFRAGFVAKQTPLTASHISQRRPDLIRRYGSYYWLDPGEPDARRQAIDVITDVVRRYDVDAVHIDDYFYPYQERDARGRLIPFPDEASWAEHGAKTGLGRNDWRRSNIDTFIEQMYFAVRSEKPHVRVGISPFGIWRPGHPASVRGLDSYSELYADTRKWLVNGWADYYAPQLYWRTDAPQQPYTDLLQWWSEQNPWGRHIWAGNIPNNINDTARGWRSSEILEQVRLTREHSGATGNIHFSATSLRRNPGGLHEAFRGSIYAAPALVPASPWLANGPTPPPSVSATPDPGLHATAVYLEPRGEGVARWIVQARWGDEWETVLLPGRTAEYHFDWRRGMAPDLIAVRLVDRAGVESDPVMLTLGGNDRSAR
ncbi:hypothetical protein BH23GEM9_BH23GEM9_31360 [soil metagenome]